MKKFEAEIESEVVKRVILEATANYGFEAALKDVQKFKDSLGFIYQKEKTMCI